MKLLLSIDLSSVVSVSASMGLGTKLLNPFSRIRFWSEAKA